MLSQTFATFCLVLLIMSKTRPSAKCNCYVFRKFQFGLTEYLKMSNLENRVNLEADAVLVSAPLDHSYGIDTLAKVSSGNLGCL